MAFQGFFQPKCHRCANSKRKGFAVILEFIFWLNTQIKIPLCPLLLKAQPHFHSSNSHWTQPFTTNCLSPTISQYLSKCEQLFALLSSTFAILFYGLHTPKEIEATQIQSNPESVSILWKTDKTTRKTQGKQHQWSFSMEIPAHVKILQKCAKSQVLKTCYIGTTLDCRSTNTKVPQIRSVLSQTAFFTE